MTAETYVSRFERLVVVAPHPDDDVLGCGGSLAAAVASGVAVEVVYVTDGGASHVGSAAYPRAALCDAREREARAALAALGVRSEPCFLRIADGTVGTLSPAEFGSVVAAVAGAIPAGEHALVMGPWVRDHHADHLAVAAIVRRAVARRPRATLLEYAIWLDELGTEHDRPQPGEGAVIALDITKHLARKSAALAAHRSQLGSLITDAATAFTLPPALLTAAARPLERFFDVRARS